MSLHFIHITDLHLSHPGMNDANLHSDTFANLKKMVAQIRTMSPAPAFIVASGDLTNHGDEASYQLLRDTVAGLDVPVVYALGNHDNRAAFRRVFSDIAAGNTAPPDAAYYHHQVLGGLHIITLDSSVPERVGGQIGPEQFGFLETALRDFSDLPKLLVIHHPPLIANGALAWESLDQKDTDTLAAMLRGHNIAALLSGHIHFNRVSHWHGIPLIVSNGLHATIDVLKPEGMQIRAGTGFGFCTWRSSGISVSFVPLTPELRVLGEISGEVLRSFK